MVNENGVSGKWLLLLAGVFIACGPRGAADESGGLQGAVGSIMEPLVAPHIITISPEHGSPRGHYTLKVKGTGFTGTNCTLEFGTFSFKVTPLAGVEVDLPVPSLVGARPKAVKVTVTCDGLTSNAAEFYYIESAITLLPPMTAKGSADQRDLAIADLDGDGNKDLVVANPQSDRLTLYLGTGDGHFAAVRDNPDLTDSLKVTTGPCSVVAQDLDHDGRIDLAVTHFAASAVTIFWNNPPTMGTWRFAPDPRSVATLATVEPKAIVVTDLDGDGWEDLIVSHPTSQTIVYLQITEHRVVKPGLPISAPVGATPSWTVDSIAAADLNGNGFSELITLSNGGQVLTIIPDGTHFADPWQWMTLPIEYRGPVIADLNLDGKKEIVLGAAKKAQVAVIQVDSKGDLNGTTSFATEGPVQSLDVADVDGDSFPDVVVGLTDAAENSLDVLAGDPVVMLKPFKAMELGSRGGLVRVANMNKDMLVDAVILDTALPLLSDGNHLLTVRPNEGTGFTPLWLMNTGSTQPFVMTHLYANLDPYVDIAIADMSAKTLRSFIGNGIGVFYPAARTTPLKATPRCLAAGNYSHDLASACDDIVVCRSEPGNTGIDLYPDTGCDGSFPGRFRTMNTAAIPIAIAKDETGAGLNNDSWSDFVVGSNSGATPLLTLVSDFPKSVSFTPLTYRAGLKISSLTMANFGGSNNDVLAAAPLNDAIYAFTDDGLGKLGPARKVASSVAADNLVVADFNGDSRRDFATLSSSLGTLSLFFNDGAGKFLVGPSVNFGATSTPSAMAVGDFNQDGVPDLAVRLDETMRVKILLGRGDGQFLTADTEVITNSGGALDVVDVNNDGAADLVISGSKVSKTTTGWLITLLTGTL